MISGRGYSTSLAGRGSGSAANTATSDRSASSTISAPPPHETPINHLYPTTGIPTHAYHPFTRLPCHRAAGMRPGLAHAWLRLRVPAPSGRSGAGPEGRVKG